MKIMGNRSIHLLQAYIGYQKTGIPLIEYNGTMLPFCAYDDRGIYIIIPKIASLLSLSIEQATSLFFNGTLLFSWIVSMAGFYYVYHQPIARLCSGLVITLLSFVAYCVGDVYLFYASCPMIMIPWSLYALKINNNRSYFIFFAFGILGGISHYIRAHSATASLLFVVILMLQARIFSLRKKIILLSSLIIGIITAHSYFHEQFVSYQNYLQKHSINQVNFQHLFWHPIYVGFGFLTFGNPDNITFSDTCAAQKVAQLHPQIACNSSEYEEVLKNEVIHLIKHHLRFVINTIFSKIGVLLFYFLMFANIGILAFYRYGMQRLLLLPFAAAFMFSALFPILTVPVAEYTLGFIAITTLWSLLVIINAIFISTNSCKNLLRL